MINAVKADRAQHVVRQIALEHAHSTPLTIGGDVGGEIAFVFAPVDVPEVSGREGQIAIPSVDPAVAFESEEERITVVRAQHDHSSRLWPEVANPAVWRSLLKAARINGEHTAAAPVREDQAPATVPTTHQSEVEHVFARAIYGRRLRKDEPITLVRGHVVNQNRSHGCIGHVDEDPAIRTAVRHDILEPGQGARQVGQIDDSQHLKEKRAISYCIGVRRIFSTRAHGTLNLFF